MPFPGSDLAWVVENWKRQELRPQELMEGIQSPELAGKEAAMTEERKSVVQVVHDLQEKGGEQVKSSGSLPI
jgi:hypothetical protein